MKGICQCCECAYYNMKQHKCNRGCKAEPELSKDEDVRFFADCPLPEAEAVKHGRWLLKNRQISDVIVKLPTECANCGFSEFNAERYNFCPNCGVRMVRSKKYGDIQHSQA